MSKVIKLPSGAELTITLSPFATSKALYQAVLEELRGVKVAFSDDVDMNMVKDLFCIGFSSKKIDAALAECMKRVTYNGIKISEETWEPESARDDYMKACIEVAKENIAPFVKSLYAESSTLLALMTGNAPALRPPTMPS